MLILVKVSMVEEHFSSSPAIESLRKGISMIGLVEDKLKAWLRFVKKYGSPI